MTGTIFNLIAIMIGGLIGLRFGKLLSEKAKDTITTGLGLFTLAIGLKMFLDTNDPLIVLAGVLIGGLLGELIRIETRIHSLGEYLENKINRNSTSQTSKNNFIRGFLASSILFCTGPMAILGAIQDGLSGDYQLLAVKSVMDGFSAFALASSFGPGVLFSAAVVFIYQGTFSVLASQFQGVMTGNMVAEMTATGGILLIGLSLSSLLQIKKIRVGNLIPSLLISPLIVFILSLINS